MFEWWWEFLYSISHAINQCLDALFKLFLFFGGAADADVNSEFTGSGTVNPLKTLFTNQTVAIWFAGILGLALLVFVISIIIAMVRTEVVGNDNKEGKIKIFKSCLKGMLLLILLPAIFGIAIRAVSILMSGISSAMATEEGNNSFAQELFDICIPDQSGEFNYNWDSSYSQLVNELNMSGGGSMHDYNYFIAYVGGIIMLFILGLAVLNLIERIIDLVFLYIISPVIIAVSPLDEGNRLGIWKDLTIAKFLSIAGMLVCFYIYFLFMSVINTLLTGKTFLIGFTKLICAIGGALAAKKGGLLISNMVGHNTALIEGQQQGIAAQAVGTGFRAGLGVIGALGHSAIHLLGAGAAGVGSLVGRAGTAATAGVAGAAVSSAATAATGVAAATVGAGATTFRALSESYNATQASGGSFSSNPTSNNTSISEAASPVVSAASPTLQGTTAAGQRMAQPPTGGNTVAAPEVTPMQTETPSVMPPISSDIQNVISNTNGFNSGNGNAGKQ